MNKQNLLRFKHKASNCQLWSSQKRALSGFHCNTKSLGAPVVLEDISLDSLSIASLTHQVTSDKSHHSHLPPFPTGQTFRGVLTLSGGKFEMNPQKQNQLFGFTALTLEFCFLYLISQDTLSTSTLEIYFIPLCRTELSQEHTFYIHMRQTGHFAARAIYGRGTTHDANIHSSYIPI